MLPRQSPASGWPTGARLRGALSPDVSGRRGRCPAGRRECRRGVHGSELVTPVLRQFQESGPDRELADSSQRTTGSAVLPGRRRTGRRGAGGARGDQP
ncbi:hypothetical protein PACID_31490 [Acidipropionibacterium acidipropionici ATCC 4875]|uniref:Uncharacterized protein n=1 Tax=Acidipropionibacterium acidipropionici (strain ATCC 4875 / DSM 20272 / JCM 6432 / NBRC 12425 / NCIMB 8070 / 4) TaxID=1171373 RepID=K7RSA8_ACIA4|nr:hypothetical protein PACID_31490 [Acidipropionibacterium acidipropionici ATCC 4875]